MNTLHIVTATAATPLLSDPDDQLYSMCSLIMCVCFQGPPGPHGNPGFPGPPGVKVLY